MLAAEDSAAQPANAETAEAAASVLVDLAALCLYADAEERLLSAEDEDVAEDEQAAAAMAVPQGGAPALAQLQLPAPPHATAEAASVALPAALPALALAGAAWAAAAPDSGLAAALRRLRRARRVLRSAGIASAACDAAEAAATALEGAALLELGRRRYGAGALGGALAAAQAAASLSPHAAAALGLLADVRAALRLPRSDADAAAHDAQWRAERRTQTPSGDGPGGRAEAQRDAAVAAYGAALQAAAALQSRVSAAGPRPGGSLSRLQLAADWELTGCATAEALRALRRRQAALLNEAGQAGVAAAARRDADAAAVMSDAERSFAAAASTFDAAGDAANAALVRRNLAHAYRQRALLALPRDDCASRADDWRLAEYAAAADACRAAARGLRRREAQPDVWDVVQAELAQALLAEGVLRLRTAGDDGPEHAAAVAALTTAAQSLSALGTRAAADAAVAHYHLGDALTRPLLSRAAASRGDRAAAARAEALPARHLQKALAFFTPASFPADHARIRLKLASLAGLPPALQGALDAALLRVLQDAARAASAPGPRAERARAAYAAALRAKAADAPLVERLALAAPAQPQRDAEQ